MYNLVMTTEQLQCPVCNQPKLIVGIETEGSSYKYHLACGHTLITLYLSDTVHAYDTIGSKRRGFSKFSKKHVWNLEQFSGNRIGRDGKLAFVEQVIDRARNYYKKYVRVGNRVIKNIESKLIDHK